jgi:hypothetical protein
MQLIMSYSLMGEEEGQRGAGGHMWTAESCNSLEESNSAMHVLHKNITHTRLFYLKPQSGMRLYILDC